MENKENLQESNINLESKEKLKLLKKEVYSSIAKEFNISQDTAKKLAKFKNESWLDSFKNLKKEIELNSKINEKDKNSILWFTSDKLENLYNAINGAEKLITNKSIDNIEVILIWDKKSLSKKLFPKLYELWVSPKSNSEQIIWFCLWSMDSCSTTVKLLYDIWKWVVICPNHIYMILKWKWQYKKLDKFSFFLALLIVLSFLIYILFFYI